MNYGGDFDHGRWTLLWLVLQFACSESKEQVVTNPDIDEARSAKILEPSFLPEVLQVSLPQLGCDSADFCGYE